MKVLRTSKNDTKFRPVADDSKFYFYSLLEPKIIQKLTNFF